MWERKQQEGAEQLKATQAKLDAYKAEASHIKQTISDGKEGVVQPIKGYLR